MSLADRKIVVTRAAEQSAPLMLRLEALDATPILFPTIRTEFTEDAAAVDRMLERIDAYDAVLFTSQNAVRSVLEAASRSGRSLSGIRAAAIGPATSAMLADKMPLLGLPAHAATGEGFAAALCQHYGPALAGQRLLVPEGSNARGVLPAALLRAGAVVDCPLVYRVVNAEPPRDDLLPTLEAADGVTFMSGMTVEAWLDVVPAGARILERAKVAVVGPVTARAADALGVRVDAVASEPTVEGLVDALAQAWAM